MSGSSDDLTRGKGETPSGNAKSPAPGKAVARKAVTRKATAGKTPAKKAPTRKAAAKKAVAKKAVAKKAAARKAVARKATASAVAPGKARKAVPAATITAEQRWRMVSEAAYHLAEKRNFASGDDIGDWLRAETQVDDQLRARGIEVIA